MVNMLREGCLCGLTLVPFHKNRRWMALLMQMANEDLKHINPNFIRSRVTSLRIQWKDADVMPIRNNRVTRNITRGHNPALRREPFRKRGQLPRHPLSGCQGRWDKSDLLDHQLGGHLVVRFVVNIGMNSVYSTCVNRCGRRHAIGKLIIRTLPHFRLKSRQDSVTDARQGFPATALRSEFVEC